MIIIPAVLFARSTSIGAHEHYGKQHVPYGPAVRQILATNNKSPALIVSEEAYLPGNIRLHAPEIPVAAPAYAATLATYPFDDEHPWLAVWRQKDGTPSADVPATLRKWVERDPRLRGAEWAAGMVAPPYNYGKPGDVYSFSYAWIRPKSP
jgi:hypothetical protein